MYFFIKKNVSLLLFFLTLFSDTILSGNLLFSLSVKSDIGKPLSDTLSDDRSKDQRAQIRSKKRFNDFGKTNDISTDSETGHGFEEQRKPEYTFFWIGLALTILFFVIGLTLFPVGSAAHQAFLIVAALLLCFTAGNFIWIVMKKDRVSALFLYFTLTLLIATAFHLLFVYAFPNYLFLFVFSMLHCVVGTIIFFIFEFLFIFDKLSPMEKTSEISISENNDEYQRGVDSKLFNVKIF